MGSSQREGYKRSDPRIIGAVTSPCAPGQWRDAGREFWSGKIKADQITGGRQSVTRARCIETPSIYNKQFPSRTTFGAFAVKTLVKTSRSTTHLVTLPMPQKARTAARDAGAVWTNANMASTSSLERSWKGEEEDSLKRWAST